MPGWIKDVQGYREILDSAGEPVQRRKTFQVIGATVTDDGEVTVIEVPPGATGTAGATGATGPGGDGTTHSQFVLVEDFMAVAPNRTTTGIFQGDRCPWTFTVLGGTASVIQRTTTIDPNHPGQAQFATGPTTGEWTLVLGDSDLTTQFNGFGSFGAVYRTSSLFANTIMMFGMSAVANTLNTATVSAFFYADPATHANFRARTRDGGVQTANIDTGVAIVGGEYKVFRIDRDPTTNALLFYINEVLVASITQATHSIDPTDELKLCAYFKNNVAGVPSPIFDMLELTTIANVDRLSA
jgi:hypothetical protein